MRVELRIAFAVLLLFAAQLPALETDQFTVPDAPLKDVGADFDAKIVASLKNILAKANATHARELAQANDASYLKYWRGVHQKRADDAISRRTIARALYDDLSGGDMEESRIEIWLRRTTTKNKPDGIFAPSMSDSVYGNNPFRRPALIVVLSPTVRLHGQYIGTDKVGHFLQQGYEYFDDFLDARQQGKSDTEATRIAVAGGVGQEHGIYGEALIGVYSNADLAANLSGLLFYRNLLETVQVGDKILEPIIVRQGDQLVLSARADRDLTQPYVAEQWNEALNPCRYTRHWRPYLRERIAQRLTACLAFYHSDTASESDRLTRMSTIFGQEYGYSGPDGLITLANAGPPPVLAAK